MSPEINGNVPFRTPSKKEKIIRTFTAAALGGSIIIAMHQDRESSESDFLQISSSYVLKLESDNDLLNPGIDNFKLQNSSHDIEGPNAPTEQEMLADISYQFDNAAKEHKEQLKAEEQRKNQQIKKIISSETNGQVTAAGVGLSEDNVWDILAHCESTDDWHINTGNGYYGGLQMDMQFWTSYGGPEFAERPDLATKEQQISVAKRARDGGHRGYDPWPTCASNNGLE